MTQGSEGKAAMSETTDDPRRPIQFGSLHKTALKLLPFSIGITALGIFMVYDAMDNPYGRREQWEGWMMFCGGLAFTILVLVRLGQKNRQSLFLSPLGIKYSDIGEAIIPWSEIVKVDSIDTVFGTGRSRHTVKNATALTVSREFYDARYETGNVMTSPTAFNIGNFKIRDDTVQIVIDHEMLHVRPSVIRNAVESRWRLFGPQDAVSASDEVPRIYMPTYYERFMRGLGEEFRSLFGFGKSSRKWGRKP
jgi:hypothetical protein